VYDDKEAITQVLVEISIELAFFAKQAIKDFLEGRILQYSKRETFKKWAAEAIAHIAQVIGLEPKKRLVTGKNEKGKRTELKTTIMNLIT
jgi:hypothetical protein